MHSLNKDCCHDMYCFRSGLKFWVCVWCFCNFSMRYDTEAVVLIIWASLSTDTWIVSPTLLSTEWSLQGSKLRWGPRLSRSALTKSGDLTVIGKELADREEGRASISGSPYAPKWRAARRCVARRKTALSGKRCIDPLASCAERSLPPSPPSICSSA